MKKTVTVRTYVVCTSSGQELPTPMLDYAEAKAALIKLRNDNPLEFCHLEERTEEEEP